MSTKCAYYKIKKHKFKIEYSNEFVISIKKINNDEKISDNQRSWLSDIVKNQLEEYFDGKRKEFDFKYKLYGTNFQIKVWKYLSTIPYGETRSYKDVSIAINKPKSYRAVGNANNKNPIVIVIPCHRVIKSNKKIGGYGLGIEMKNDLLNHELKKI